MAAAFTGVQRSQPTLATAPVPLGESARAAAGLSAVALASVPPNHGREADVVERAGQGVRVLGHGSSGGRG